MKEKFKSIKYLVSRSSSGQEITFAKQTEKTGRRVYVAMNIQQEYQLLSNMLYASPLIWSSTTESRRLQTIEN